MKNFIKYRSFIFLELAITTNLIALLIAYSAHAQATYFFGHTNCQCKSNIRFHRTAIDSCLNFVNPYYLTINVRDYIHIDTNEKIDSLRNDLIKKIWKNKDSLPKNHPDSIVTGLTHKHFINDTLYPNLASLDEYIVSMDSGFVSYVYRLHPILSKNKLMLVHQGHNVPEADGIKETIGYFLNLGYDILYFNMPLMNFNTGPISETSVTGHNLMQFMETDSLNPLKFFVEPISVSLNFIDSIENYDEISMIGVSGGGWTTTLYAAIDPRIQNSFPVAGSLPDYLRVGPCPNGSIGDWEQAVIEVEDTLSYIDLYIMGATGRGRKQIQILNKYDACCFSGVNYTTYDTIVIKKVDSLLYGSFEVFLDTTHYEHKISYTALDYIYKSILGNCLPVVNLLSPQNDISEGINRIKSATFINSQNKVIGNTKIFLEAKNYLLFSSGFEVIPSINGSLSANISDCASIFYIGARSDSVILNINSVADSIPVLANDSLNMNVASHSNVNLSIIKNPKKGVATFNNNSTIKYIPNFDFVGYDTLIYAICDKVNNLLCDTTIVTFRVIVPNINRMSTSQEETKKRPILDRPLHIKRKENLFLFSF